MRLSTEGVNGSVFDTHRHSQEKITCYLPDNPRVDNSVSVTGVGKPKPASYVSPNLPGHNVVVGVVVNVIVGVCRSIINTTVLIPHPLQKLCS